MQKRTVLREIKEFWRSALVLSILLYPTDIGLTRNSSSVVAELTDRKELFNRVDNAIMELGLEKVWELKPLVNGKDIMSILQLKSEGPVVKEWLLGGSFHTPRDLRRNALIG